MPKQTVLWTTLPNGVAPEGNRLRVSILAAPRLEPDPGKFELNAFPDFKDWPATLLQSTYVLRFGGGSVTISPTAPSAGGRIDPSIGMPDSALWKAIFPGSTFVRGFAFKDLAQSRVLSYNVRQLAALVRELYTSLARNAGDELPKISAVAQDPGWAKVIAAVRGLDRKSYDEKNRMREPRRQFAAFLQNGLASENPVAEVLARLQLFHTPAATPQVQTYENLPADDPRTKAAWRTYARGKLPGEADFAKEIDFHQRVAAMNQYPTLLRKLGLVIDFLVDPTRFPFANDDLLYAEVKLPQATGPTIRQPDASPRTHARLADGLWCAVPRPSAQAGDFRVREGLLDLHPSQFALIQEDTDAAGLKIMNFARTLARLSAAEVRYDEVTRFEREIGSPALRNAGLTLVHTHRGAMLSNNFTRSKVMNDALKAGQAGGGVRPELYAEDVVRGYRIDIWDGREAGAAGEWRSLCLREALYEIAGGLPPVAVAGEEGTVRLAATLSPDPASNPGIIYLHEALTAWTGWSLCVPPYGQAVDANDTPSPAEAEVPAGIPLKTTFRVKAGSLPRLRYGRKYWIRARVVDLAGNSLAPQATDFGPEKPAQRAAAYLRYEPIAAPAIALSKKPGGDIETPRNGESMERLAIRTYNDTPAGNSVPSAEEAQRTAVPARQSAREAEHHGALDRAGRLDPGTFALLATKDAPLPEVKLTLGGPLATPVETTYTFFEAGGALPYLPDPLAEVIAARILDLPGHDPEAVIPIPLYAGDAAWPHAVPFRVRIFEKPGEAAAWNAGARELAIPLPKAALARLRLSVMPSARALGLMGIWNYLSSTERAALEKRALSGRHWMLTPWRTLALVHAVQRPLIAPDILQHRMSRRFQDTKAAPYFVANCSIKSTDRLDLQASWNEPRDESAHPVPTNETRDDHAYSIKITDPQRYAARIYDPKATGNAEHAILSEDVIECGAYIKDRATNKFHQFRDTRYRRIEYWFEATTRFREYMPVKFLTENGLPDGKPTDTHLKVAGKRLVSWVPNASPPPLPEVLYVIPTFGWTRGNSQRGWSSMRRGGGLRVYLDRPWSSSGYGEMLAVVVPPAGFSGDPNSEPAGAPYKNFVTQWGNDPSWASPFVRGAAPKRANFPLARTAPDPGGKWLPPGTPATEADQPPGAFRAETLQPPALAAMPNAKTVEIAPHDVFYDPERQLWYCDIEVHQGSSYFPFIRLALARYQPVSVEGAHLSNVVLADFMQLAPDRWLSVTAGEGRGSYRVRLSGRAPSDSSSAKEARSAPSVSIQRPGLPPLTLVPAAVAKSTVVQVWAERLDPVLGADFGWRRDTTVKIEAAPILPIGRRTPKNPTDATAAARAASLLSERRFDLIVKEGLLELVPVVPSLWNGVVTVPQGLPDGTRLRLVVAEYEEYLADDANAYDRVPTAKGERLVYVEHLELKIR
ncbi:MAG: hypothetical protein MUE48_00920 [Desulfobacterales bacterium]|nr:hypothetical protein [Desulfobacterales bacterium]